MTELSIVKRRLLALTDAIQGLEECRNKPVEVAPVNIKEELNKLNLEELKEISDYLTTRMIEVASGKPIEKKGSRMPLAMKQNMVNRYLDEGDADQGEKDWYRFIESKKSKERNEEEKKKFMEFRNRAQKWYEEHYPATEA